MPDIPDQLAGQLNDTGRRLTELGVALQRLADGRGIPGCPTRQLDAIRLRLDRELAALGSAAADLDVHSHAASGIVDLQRFLNT